MWYWRFWHWYCHLPSWKLNPLSNLVWSWNSTGSFLATSTALQIFRAQWVALSRHLRELTMCACRDQDSASRCLLTMASGLDRYWKLKMTDGNDLPCFLFFWNREDVHRGNSHCCATSCLESHDRDRSLTSSVSTEQATFARISLSFWSCQDSLCLDDKM